MRLLVKTFKCFGEKSKVKNRIFIFFFFCGIFMNCIMFFCPSGLPLNIANAGNKGNGELSTNGNHHQVRELFVWTYLWIFCEIFFSNFFVNFFFWTFLWNFSLNIFLWTFFCWTYFYGNFFINFLWTFFFELFWWLILVLLCELIFYLWFYFWSCTFLFLNLFVAILFIL